VKWFKFILALLLFPLLWGGIRTGMDLFQAVPHWPRLESGLFLLGFSTWIWTYLALPRPVWLYALGHESTHALAVWMSGGRVGGFKVTSQGGHVVSDRISIWIALAPYIVPFYPIAVALVWLLCEFAWPSLHAYRPLFLIFWGLVWGFHACFTASLLKTEQPDFESQGLFFSWVVILLANLWLILALLAWWLHPMPWGDLGRLAAGHTLGAYTGCARLLLDFIHTSSSLVGS
jgi:hypothetical protein